MSSERTGARDPLAFYCVTGRDFFPGAVALINSLRLCGHTEPVFVLDCGMEPRQRSALARHATVLPAPDDAPPSLQKFVAPLAHPAATMVLVDADVIVTRSLGELIDVAAAGSVVAFRNDVHRHFAEWGELLGLGEVRPGPYVTTGFLALAEGTARELLALVAERQGTVDADRTWLGGGTRETDPLYFHDQDVFNAVLHSRIAPDRVLALEARLAPIPPFDGVELLDERSLRCAYRDGSRPYLLHHAASKPWLVPMRANVYSRLLTRLLLADDVPLRLDPAELPVRLRTGAAARARRFATDLALVAPGALRRISGRRRRISAWPHSSDGTSR